ncbi:hypothetical protein RvY_13097 [Ramazzottius varieornatus]|uniref:Uncharacterized protein n=1 Tax=Ramazzottius varieornatus TaxID=947166 RepID=A0A1D1VLR1_RAMVA|nr:hypothetical protein RvY_13097 [Ramazzottius varieornatus]
MDSYCFQRTIQWIQEPTAAYVEVLSYETTVRHLPATSGRAIPLVKDPLTVVPDPLAEGHEDDDDAPLLQLQGATKQAQEVDAWFGQRAVMGAMTGLTEKYRNIIRTQDQDQVAEKSVALHIPAGVATCPSTVSQKVPKRTASTQESRCILRTRVNT